jgi:hypothetical protein
VFLSGNMPGGSISPEVIIATSANHLCPLLLLHRNILQCPNTAAADTADHG